jgi:hypothetical protein
MPTDPLDHERIRRICNHEAGYHVAARVMRFQTGGISAAVVRSAGHSANSNILLWKESIPDQDRLIDYLERRIKVLYAGTIAESMDVQGNYDQDHALYQWRLGGSMGDYAKIRELVQLIRTVRHPQPADEQKAQEQLNQIDLRLLTDAVGIIRNKIAVVYGIGDGLYQKIQEYNVQYVLTEMEIGAMPQVMALD